MTAFQHSAKTVHASLSTAPYGAVVAFFDFLNGKPLLAPAEVLLPEGFTLFSRPGDPRALALFPQGLVAAQAALENAGWGVEIADATPKATPPAEDSLAYLLARPTATDTEPKPEHANAPSIAEQDCADALFEGILAAPHVLHLDALLNTAYLKRRDWERETDETFARVFKNHDVVQPSVRGHTLPLMSLVSLNGAQTLRISSATGSLDLAFHDEDNQRIALNHATKLCAILMAQHPSYSFELGANRLVVRRDGAPYAELKTAISSGWRGQMGWNGTINGKAWNPVMSDLDDIVKALDKRIKAHEPVYALRDPATGRFFAKWDDNGEALFDERTNKARTWKRLADAIGHVMRANKAYHFDAPTHPDWENAYTAPWQEFLDMTWVKGFACPIEAVAIDKGQGSVVVTETAGHLDATIARRRAITRNVSERYGAAAAVVLDALRDSERTDLDTLVAAHDQNGTFVMKNVLKTAGIDSKKAIVRKTLVGEDYGNEPQFVVWSVAITAADLPTLLAALPPKTPHVSMPVASALA